MDNLAADGVSGERVEIVGRVLDGDGQGVPDAMLELWQANSQGKFAHPEDTQEKPIDTGFRGYGRVATAEDGSFHFTTIKPGRVPGPGDKLQAPHICVSVFARGLLRRLVTRIGESGFSCAILTDEPANPDDFALNHVDHSRWGTLIANKSTKGDGVLEWNVVLQGPQETVFFDC